MPTQTFLLTPPGVIAATPETAHLAPHPGITLEVDYNSATSGPPGQRGRITDVRLSDVPVLPGRLSVTFHEVDDGVTPMVMTGEVDVLVDDFRIAPDQGTITQTATRNFRAMYGTLTDMGRAVTPEDETDPTEYYWLPYTIVWTWPDRSGRP